MASSTVLSGAWLGLFAALSLSSATADPVSTNTINGRPQKLAVHRPPHHAPISNRPEVEPLAAAQAVLVKAYSGTPIDVLAYHYDDARTGWNQSETDLTPATVESANFGLLKTLVVDGNVFAQPLAVSSIAAANGRLHNMVIVATGHNSVYAYDSDALTLLWHVNLGTPQSTNDVGCGDVQPEYGISSTPVIVRNGPHGAVIYLVAATEPSAYSFHTSLHALNAATGADLMVPTEIAPQATLADGSTVAFDPQNQWSRAGLAIRGTSVYIGIGSHCDNNSGAITGWLLRYSTANLSLQSSFHTIETAHGGTELASIWMTGFAPALDPTGRVFVVTGNGDYTNGAGDWGESALELSPTLSAVYSRFTPAGFADLNNGDVDFGSGGIMLVPTLPNQAAPPMAVAIGKSSVLYLLNQHTLGRLQANDQGALQSIDLGNAGTWGGPAYYDGPSGQLVYVQTDNAVLQSFAVNSGATPSLTLAAQGTSYGGYGGSLPIVTSNGAAPGTGIVWLIRRSVPMELEAYDASVLGDPIYAANAGTWSNTQNQNSFVTPMAADGRVYVPAYKTVKIFGLTQAAQ